MGTTIVNDVVSLGVLATAACIPLLWRIIRIQKTTIQALSLHVQTLTAYLETVTHRIKRKRTGEAGDRACSSKGAKSDSEKIHPVNRENIGRAGHKKAS